jgi:hypothetical protein
VKNSWKWLTEVSNCYSAMANAQEVDPGRFYQNTIV